MNKKEREDFFLTTVDLLIVWESIHGEIEAHWREKFVNDLDAKVIITFPRQMVIATMKDSPKLKTIRLKLDKLSRARENARTASPIRTSRQSGLRGSATNSHWQVPPSLKKSDSNLLPNLRTSPTNKRKTSVCISGGTVINPHGHCNC
jgi:hypothetical protein